MSIKDLLKDRVRKILVMRDTERVSHKQLSEWAKRMREESRIMKDQSGERDRFDQ